MTIIAARTATAGQLFVYRWASTALIAYVHRILAKFTLTTAYTTPQETGCDLILASSFTVDGTNGTAVDCGSTVAATGKKREIFAKSVIGAGDVRVADASAITAGTHVLHANPIATLSDWSGAVGDTVPRSTSGAKSGYGTLYDSADHGGQPLPFDEASGFVIRNMLLMGAVGVGRWDFQIEWDEGTGL